MFNRGLGPNNGWTFGMIPNIIRLYDGLGEHDKADAWRETHEQAKAANEAQEG